MADRHGRVIAQGVAKAAQDAAPARAASPWPESFTSQIAYPAHTGPHGDQYAEPTTLGKRPGPASGHRASSIVPPLGWVRLEDEDDPGIALLCRLGEGNVDLTAGVGGWDVIRRPGRTPVTRWRGRSELRIDVPLYLNDERRRASSRRSRCCSGSRAAARKAARKSRRT
jgi:hypothetical protein